MEHNELKPCPICNGKVCKGISEHGNYRKGD